VLENEGGHEKLIRSYIFMKKKEGRGRRGRCKTKIK
jgi:hypothetical protein